MTDEQRELLWGRSQMGLCRGFKALRMPAIVGLLRKRGLGCGLWRGILRSCSGGG
jgi:hypothetical protein